MLGRLFSTANSTNTSPGGTRPSTAAAPDSDELHTRGLLYPDTSSSFQSCLSLSHTSNSSNFGDNIDLDANRDVRVIIAQDATASEHKCVLYDSKPAPKITETSHGAFEDGPLSPALGGPYNRSRRSRAAPSAQFHTNSTTYSQHASGNVAPEDEMRVLTDCMFGSAPLAYKGPSTKVHILPNIEERKPISESPRRGSLRAPSFTSYEPIQPVSSSKDKRKSVLITRLFSVVIPPTPPVTAYPTATPTPASSVGSAHGFPFPKMTTSSNTTTAAAKFVKPPKTSMYSVGLIISLPQPSQYSCSSTGSSIHRCCCCQQSSFGAYDSDNHQHEFCCPTPPSFDEDYNPPVMESLGYGNGFDDFPSPVADDRMDLITKHWDVINRALADLQRVVQAQILNHLNAGGLASSQTACQNGYKYRRKIELRQGALLGDEVVRKEVERLRWRIVAGIRTPRVITGQGKWAVWKDEAKWANARFGGRDMNLSVAFPWLIGLDANKPKNSFFLTLLTAFLGHHTEWLDVLGPAPYRLKHQQQQQKANGNGDECAIPTRTVLLASDKHSARRLIYLLSAFLPSKSLPPWDGIPPPSRTDSMNYLSQSPPVSAAASGLGNKKSSLRKKAKKKPSKLSMVTGEEDEPIESVVGWDIPVVHGESNVVPPALQLPLANPAVKKASSGTLTTALGSATTNAPGSPQKTLVRPGSSSSVASMNLMSTLKRTGTANTSADSSSSFLSFWSFWSNASNTRTGSTAPSEASTQPDDNIHSEIKIADGRDEVSVDGRGLYLDDDDILHHHIHHKHAHHTMPAPSLMPYGFHQQYVENEVRLSVDESDGIVDVDIPMPSMDYGAVFTSPISSPSSSGWTMSMMETAGPGLMRSNSMSFSSAMLMPTLMPDLDDNGINVGGWMEDEIFHPDFALQAVKPYAELEEDIKRAMRAEPTPPHAGSNTPASENETDQGDNKWVEVCSVLVADTKKLQIKRLRLRRRCKKSSPVAGNQSPPMTAFPSALGGHRHLHVQQPVPQQPSVIGFEEEEEEVMDEEIVCDVDDVLATAVEKVIGISGASRRKTGPNTVDDTQNMGVQVCKCMVLGALEDVVRAVAVDRGSVVGNFLTEGVAKWLSEVDESF